MLALPLNDTPPIFLAVANIVAVAASPEYPEEVIVPRELPLSENVIVPPFASIVISPSTSKVKSPPSDIVEPLIVISSTVKDVNFPHDVLLACATVCNVPAICLAVNLPVLGL